MTAPLTLPAWSLSWAVIPAAGLPRGRAQAQARLALLEAHLPQSHDHFHVTWTRRSGGDWIACAIPRERLAPLLEGRPRSVLPESLPDFILGPEDDPERLRASLNLARGAPVPPAALTARRRTIGVAVAITSLAWLGLSVGLMRRADFWHREEARLRAREQQVVVAALGPGPGVPALRMQAALRQAPRSPAPVPPASAPDPELTLESLCRLWPTSSATLERLSVNEQGASLVALTRDLAASTGLVRALALPGLAPPSHQVAASPEGVRVTIRWSPLPPADSTRPGGRP